MEETEETIMLQIKDTLVSLDLAEQFFCCDISQCLGQCCIDGDAGAPITEEERDKLNAILPEIEKDLLPRAVEKSGRRARVTLTPTATS